MSKSIRRRVLRSCPAKSVDNDSKEESTVRRVPVCFRRLPYFFYQDLTEPIDVYSEWIDAADAAQNEADAEVPSRSLGIGGSSRPRRADFSDED